VVKELYLFYHPKIAKLKQVGQGGREGEREGGREGGREREGEIDNMLR